jgi:hypothetical protein
VQREAAFLIYVAIDARRWRDAALRDLTPDEQRALFQLLTLPIKAFEGALSGAEPSAELLLLERALDKVDLPRLLAGGHDCAPRRAAEHRGVPESRRPHEGSVQQAV